jgi:hypothetical protein
MGEGFVGLGVALGGALVGLLLLRVLRELLARRRATGFLDRDSVRFLVDFVGDLGPAQTDAVLETLGRSRRGLWVVATRSPAALRAGLLRYTLKHYVPQRLWVGAVVERQADLRAFTDLLRDTPVGHRFLAIDGGEEIALDAEALWKMEIVLVSTDDPARYEALAAQARALGVLCLREEDREMVAGALVALSEKE